MEMVGMLNLIAASWELQTKGCPHCNSHRDQTDNPSKLPQDVRGRRRCTRHFGGNIITRILRVAPHHASNARRNLSDIKSAANCVRQSP
jgi:hypothetical protein